MRFKVHFEGDFEVEAENEQAAEDYVGTMSDADVCYEINYWDITEGE